MARAKTTSKAKAKDEPRPQAPPVTTFPGRLLNGTLTLTLSPPRVLLLLHKKKTHALDHLLEEEKLVHDDGGSGGRRVNSTYTALWVRTANGEPLEPKRLTQLFKAANGAIKSIVPVYRRDGVEGPAAFVAPLPGSMLARLGKQNDESHQAFAKTVAKFDGVVDATRSNLLRPFVYIALKDTQKHPSFQIGAQLRDALGGQISELLYDLAPLLSPLAMPTDPDDSFYDGTLGNKETAGSQWNMRRVGSRYAWDPVAGPGQGSGAVTLYLFDLGVLTRSDLPPYAGIPTAKSMSQFAFSNLSNPNGIGIDLSTENADSNNQAPQSDNAHGTQMAGVMVATQGDGTGTMGSMAGLAPGVQFVSLRTGSGSPLAESDIATAIHVAGYDSEQRTQRGVLCLGTIPATFTPNGPTSMAVLAHPNLLVVCPCGDSNASPFPPPVPDNLMICGATDKSSIDAPRYDDWKADGGAGDEGSRAGADISVVAPGVGIITTSFTGTAGAYTQAYVMNAQGTSIAAAHVAGLAALVRSKDATLILGASVRTRLEQTAAKTGAISYATSGRNGPWNDHMGFGRVHAAAALVTEADVDTTDQGRADVYIRDNPQDVGGDNSGTDFWSSGDIVVMTDAELTATYPNLAPGVTTAGSAADIAFSTARDAPTTSTNVSRGTPNWMFIRVVNLGPNTAFGVRVTGSVAAPSTGFMYPIDWEVPIAGTTVVASPTVLGDDYAYELPNGGVFIARLQIAAGADYTGFPQDHGCGLARATASNDVTFTRTAPITPTGGQQPVQNNLAQRNLSIVN